MRRFAVCTAIATALLVTATAFAIDRDFAGHVDGHPNEDFTFTVVRKSGDDKKVKDVVIERIAVECDGGPQRITPPPLAGSASIDSSGKFKLVSGNSKFEGHVNGSQATGHLRVNGSFSGSSQNCDSDRVAWSADH